MTHKGICKVEMFLNGVKVLSICGDREVYKPNTDNLWICRARFI